MRVFRDLTHSGLSPSSVVTIGVFDGVHRGHRALLDRCCELRDGGHPAEDGHAGTPSDVALVTFEPAPRAWFNPQQAPPRLSGPRDKLLRLCAAGVDLVWMMRFNGRLAALPAREFVTRVLVDGLRARHVVVGEDFRFGHRREGDLDTLHELGQAHGFTVQGLAHVTEDGERISSSRIRDCLAGGDLEAAARMLGRPWSITGRVLRGQGLGRDLGYPTANVSPWGGNSPARGVFAVRARAGQGDWRDGVANLGHRPAVGGGALLLEVHLFDFDGDLYGQRLETEFVRKLRDEEDFPSLEDLVGQMARDAANARAVLATAD